MEGEHQVYEVTFSTRTPFVIPFQLTVNLVNGTATGTVCVCPHYHIYTQTYLIYVIHFTSLSMPLHFGRPIITWPPTTTTCSVGEWNIAVTRIYSETVTILTEDNFIAHSIVHRLYIHTQVHIVLIIVTPLASVGKYSKCNYLCGCIILLPLCVIIHYCASGDSYVVDSI